MWLQKKKTQCTELMLGYVAIAFAIANVIQHQSKIVTFKSSVIVIVIVMTPNKRKHNSPSLRRWPLTRPCSESVPIPDKDIKYDV